MLAAKAYDLHNAELQGTGLTINTPETMWNVPLAEACPTEPCGACEILSSSYIGTQSHPSRAITHIFLQHGVTCGSVQLLHASPASKVLHCIRMHAYQTAKDM